MGGIFSRIGSDPYYASYEKSLSRAQTDIERLKVRLASRRAFATHVRSRFLSTCAAVYVLVLAYAALVTRAAPGTYTHKQHAQRVAPALLGPPAAWLLYCLLNRGFGLLDALTERRLKSMETKLNGMITELKESTRYEKTLELLKRYDPKYRPPPPAAPPPRPAGFPGGPGQGVGQSTQIKPKNGTGVNVMPALTKLFGQAADRLIADDPMALRLLQEAQKEGTELKTALVAAETEALRLQAENRHLRAQLGLEEFGMLDYPRDKSPGSTNPKNNGSPHASETGTDKADNISGAAGFANGSKDQNFDGPPTAETAVPSAPATDPGSPDSKTSRRKRLV